MTLLGYDTTYYTSTSISITHAISTYSNLSILLAKLAIALFSSHFSWLMFLFGGETETLSNLSMGQVPSERDVNIALVACS